jgi:hypothetical protein
MEQQRRLQQENFYKKSIFEAVEETKRKIGSEILATLEDFHRQGVYVGIHGGGLTHPLSEVSDIDLAIIPPQFSPDILNEIVEALYYRHSSNPPMKEEDFFSLVHNYASEIDYISLKILRDGENPVSLHIENPEFTKSYQHRSYARELRPERKASGISQYQDVLISRRLNGGFDIEPVTVAVQQTQILGTPAVINFPHATLLFPWKESPLSPIIDLPRLIEENTGVILGLEANKIVSEVSLFEPDSINRQRFSLLRDSISKLSSYLNTNFDMGLKLYIEAYSRLLYSRKGILIPMELLINRFTVLRFLSDNEELL